MRVYLFLRPSVHESIPRQVPETPNPSREILFVGILDVIVLLPAQGYNVEWAFRQIISRHS